MEPLGVILPRDKATKLPPSIALGKGGSSLLHPTPPSRGFPLWKPLLSVAFQQGQTLGNGTVGPLGQGESPSGLREDPPAQAAGSPGHFAD